MHPTHSSTSTLFFVSIPADTDVLCDVCGDCYVSSLIFVGIVASGLSCLVFGSADFVFTLPEPTKGSPAGSGILSSRKDVVLLKGTEGAADSITCGTFSLRFSSESHYNLVRWRSLLFSVRCVTQLLLIPQASLLGQLMFLISLGVLGVFALYNTWLSSLDKEKIHRKLLFVVLNHPTLSKYTLGTRTTTAVFILLVLQLQDPTGLLNELLPNDTKERGQWKATILERLCFPNDKSSGICTDSRNRSRIC